jgi:hypothetical protein
MKWEIKEEVWKFTCISEIQCEAHLLLHTSHEYSVLVRLSENIWSYRLNIVSEFLLEIVCDIDFNVWCNFLFVGRT